MKNEAGTTSLGAFTLKPMSHFHLFGNFYVHYKIFPYNLALSFSLQANLFY